MQTTIQISALVKMNIFSLFIFAVAILLTCPDPSTATQLSLYSDSPCDNWEPYKDEKCYAIIDNALLTFTDAEKSCSSLRSYTASLPIIRSQEEQAFLTDFLFNKQQQLDNFWIGASYRNDSFNWLDGRNLTYTNWDGESPKNRENYCVLMRSDEDLLGRWLDGPCGRKNAVICQRMPTSSLGGLQKSFLEARKAFNETVVELQSQIQSTNSSLQATISRLKSDITTHQAKIDKLTRNPVPIGFKYVQLPNQLEPRSIWSNTVWSDVSSLYAGRFFRAVGGGAAAFGTNQTDSCPRLTGVYFKWARDGDRFFVTIPRDGVSSWINSGGATGGATSMQFYSTGGEVRPVNTAVRIWKRTS